MNTTYAVMTELASQREDQMAARARAARVGHARRAAPTRRTATRDRLGVTRLRALMPWA